jgi:hypothetical protein
MISVGWVNTFRNPALYPPELRGRTMKSISYKVKDRWSSVLGKQKVNTFQQFIFSVLFLSFFSKGNRQIWPPHLKPAVHWAIDVYGSALAVLRHLRLRCHFVNA